MAQTISPIPAITDEERGMSPLEGAGPEDYGITPIPAISDADYAGARALPGQGVGGYKGGTFRRGIDRGVKQTAGLFGQLMKLTGDEFGLAGMADIGDDLIREALIEALANPAEISGFEDIGTLGDVGTWALQTLGEQIPNLALAFTGGGLGGGLASYAAKQGVARTMINNVAKQAVQKQLDPKKFATEYFKKGGAGRRLLDEAKRTAGRSAAKKGAGGGLFGALFPVNTGEVIQEQRDVFERNANGADPDSPFALSGYGSGPKAATEPDLFWSAILGAGSTSLDVLGLGLVGKAVFGKAKKEVIGHTLNTVLRRIGHVTLASLRAEGGTEAVQEAIVIASRKINDPTFSITDAITSSEGLRRIAFAGASGALVGGVLGGVGGVTTSVGSVAQLNAKRARIRAGDGVSAIRESFAGRDQVAEGEAQPTESRTLFDWRVARDKYKARLDNFLKVDKEDSKKSGLVEQVKIAIASLKENVGTHTKKSVHDAFVVAVNRQATILQEIRAEVATNKKLTERADNNKGRVDAVLKNMKDEINQIPTVAEKDGKNNDAAHKISKKISEKLAAARKLSTDKRAETAAELMTLLEELTAKAIVDPTSIAKGKLESLHSAVNKFTTDGFSKLQEELTAYNKQLGFWDIRVQKALDSLPTAEALEDIEVTAAERQGRADMTVSAEEEYVGTEVSQEEAVRQTQSPTAKKKIVASAYKIIKGLAASAYARGYTDRNLPQAVQNLVDTGQLKATYDAATGETLLQLPNNQDTIRRQKELDFPKQIEELNPDQTFAATNTTRETLVDNNEDALAEKAKNDAIGEETVFKTVDEVVEENLRDLNEEAAASPVTSVQLKRREVGALREGNAYQEAELFVRTPSNNRIMHAYIDAENKLRREDGKPFRLFDDEANATKAGALKTSKEKLAGMELDVVKVGDKTVLRGVLPGSRTVIAERQVRRAIDRGAEHTKDKKTLAIEAVRPNGNTVWLHNGEVTALGLLLDAGSTQSNQKQRYSNPQTLFLDGLSYLMAEHNFVIDFRPTDVLVDGKVVGKARASDLNKVIYANTAYKDALPNQKKVAPRTRKGKAKNKGFVEWAVDKVRAGEVPPTILKGLLWNYGFFSNEEIAELERLPPQEQERTILEGLALVQSTILEGTGRKREVRRVRQPLALEEKQDISEEKLHLPSSEAQLVPIRGKKQPDKSVPYAYNTSINDQALGYQQHAPHRSTGQIQNFISRWPAAQAAVEFTLKMLNIKEKVVLYDEDSASLLMSVYKQEEGAPNNTAERSALYRGYRDEIAITLASGTPGRINAPPPLATDASGDRVTHIFVSNKRRTRHKESRGMILMHEVGHLVQYTHLDRLSPKLRTKVLEHMNDGTESFANWMAKVAVDLHFGRKVRATTEVDNIFVKIVEDLKRVWQSLKGKLAYPKGFAEFVAALNTHAAAQRGEAYVPLTGLGKQMFAELQATDNGGLIPKASPPTYVDLSTNKLPPLAPVTIKLSDSFSMDATVDEAVERAQDSFLGNVVEDMNNWGKTFKDSPALAMKTLLYTADGELRGMGPAMTKLAKRFRSLSGVEGENPATIFKKIQMRAGPFHRAAQLLFKSEPTMRISLWEILNPRPSAATRAKIAHRDRVSKALLLQTKDAELSADIKQEVQRVRQYFKDMHSWYTSPTTQDVVIHMPGEADNVTVKGMGLKLKEWGYLEEGLPAYYPMMIDSQFMAKNEAKFMEIMNRHQFAEVDAHNIRMKIIRDEDGGLNNGFQESAGTDNFFGPGFASGRERNTEWTPELRAELVKEGFYQHDIAVTMTAYTEMMVRRAVWQTEFSERRPLQGELLRRYREFPDINPHGPVARLQLWVNEAYARREINEWQYNRVIKDILPAYAGQLGLRTNPRLRKLNSGIIIYQNLRILPFAIFSQYVDVGTMAARGDFRSFQAAQRGMFDKTTRQETRLQMEILGAIRQGITEHILSEQALSTFTTSTAKRFNDLFFRYNLMEGWTNGIRVMSAIAGRNFITRNSRIALEGTGRERRKARHKMASIGLSTERELADAATWDGFTTDNDTINAALLRFVDESMIRPDPTMRPVHMSDPAYVVLDHLKNFLWGFYGTFVKRGIYEARVHHNLLPLFTLGMMALPFAALGYEMRRKILGTSKNAPEGGAYLVELTERAGLLGPWQLVMDMEQAANYGNPRLTALSGPAVEQFASFVHKDMSYWVPRAIPVVASIPAMRDWTRDKLEFEE